LQVKAHITTVQKRFSDLRHSNQLPLNQAFAAVRKLMFANKIAKIMEEAPW
jgi:hypothetical protein